MEDDENKIKILAFHDWSRWKEMKSIAMLR